MKHLDIPKTFPFFALAKQEQQFLEKAPWPSG